MKSWHKGSPAPGLEARHIVPQIHCHVYPDGHDNATNDRSWDELLEAWTRCWSPDNGILLHATLRRLFDALLFSIHPRMLRVRVFVPHDFLIEYNGTTANIHPSTDGEALRHHYEMCCIENMTAKCPQLRVPASVNTSEASTRAQSEAGTTKPDLLPPPGPRDGRTGDTSKRPRTAGPDRGRSTDASGQDDLVEEAEACYDSEEEDALGDSEDEDTLENSEDEDGLEDFTTPDHPDDFLVLVDGKSREIQIL